MPPRRSGGAAAPEIFISYASKDRAAAETVCATLESAGIRCWIAPRDVTPGVAYASVLVDAIAAARLVLVVFSHAANRSDGVLNEVEVAFNRKRPVFTVRIEDCEPKGQAEFYLRRGHWFDAFADVNERLRELPDAVRAARSAAGKRKPAATRGIGASLAPPVPAGNLVAPEGRLFGRDADLAHVVDLLSHPGALTLWGPGGVGKTRLALAAASRVDPPKGGVWFVDLAPVSDGASVPAAVASVLGIREERHRPLLTTVIEALAKRDALVVLDNCEHVIEAAAALIDRTRRSAARARFLCTSREPLAIPGETVFRLEPLALPDDDTLAAADSPAIELFIERATAAGGRVSGSADELAAIATIVRRLDGIPFAIELAAARARSMPVHDIARALDDRLRLLAGTNRGGQARQQTLRGAIDWSYQLLSEAERLVFRQLSAFVGGWTTEALRCVVRGRDLSEWDVLDAAHSLTEKSLVTLEPHSERYRLLESTREYARELLASDERTEVGRRHAEYCIDLATSVRTAAHSGSDLAFDVLRPERPNFRAAIEWALQPGGDARLGAALCAELTRFWDYDGTPLEGIRCLERAVEAYAPEQPTREEAGAWYGLALLRLIATRKDAAYDAAVRAASLAVAVADRELEARSLMVIAQYGADLGDATIYSGAIERALEIFRELGDLRWVAAALSTQAIVAWRNGEPERALEFCRQAESIAHSIGIPRILIGAQLSRAEIEFAMHDVSTAIAIARDALAGARETKNQTLILHALLNLAAYLLESEARHEALVLVREVLDATADEESIFGWKAVQVLGVLAAEAAHVEQGRRFFLASDSAFRALGYHPGETESRVHDRLVAAVGDVVEQPQTVSYATVILEAANCANAGYLELDTEGVSEQLLET